MTEAVGEYDLNVAKQYELIAKLRILAESEYTPEVEASIARARMAEIEAKIRRDYEDRVKKAKIVSPAKASFRSVLKNKIGGKSNGFPTEWPFGWTRRDQIDVEKIGFDSKNKIVLGWKCPCCNMHVKRAITPKHRARLQGSPNGVREFIRGIQDGKLNQLCDECFEQYQ